MEEGGGRPGGFGNLVEGEKNIPSCVYHMSD